MTEPAAPPLENAQFAIDPNQIPFATTGLDCPTIYIDMIRGTAVHGETTKISLIEHRVDAMTGEIRACHVINLVMPTSQLRPWGDYFTKLADQIADAEQAGVAAGNG